MTLSPAHEAELRYLRRQVDAAQDRLLRKDAEQWAQRDLWYAREELRQFVSKLREEGHNI